jgi:large subunit ribosomal protein L23
MINKAIISEKSFYQASKSKYTFIVSKDMSKDEIKRSVEKIYAVSVLSVNTSNIIGKVKRTKKGAGKRQDYKKAIVTLAKKDSIDIFEVEGDKKDNKAEKKQAAKIEKKEVIENKDVKTTIREPKKGLLGGRTTNK